MHSSLIRQSECPAVCAMGDHQCASLYARCKVGEVLYG
jgi:hypothetical protein